MYRLLLVDDNTDNLNILKRVLEKCELGEIEPYSCPYEAMDRAGECSFDLVISDYRMPGMDGIEFLKAFRKLHRDACMIVLSAFNDMTLLMEAINALGVSRVLCKPCDPGAVREAVAQTLNQREYDCRINRLQALIQDQQRVIERQAEMLLRLESAYPGITESV